MNFPNQGNCFRQFEQFPNHWDAKSYLVIHIDADDFKCRDPKKFKDLKDGCPSQIILQSLSAIICRNDMGKKYKNKYGMLDPYYCGERLPKTVEIIEEIVGGQNETDFKGFRFWIFSNDEEYDFAKGFEDLITTNNKRTKNKKTSHTHLLYQNIYSIDDLAANWGGYLRDYEHFNTEDDLLHSDEHSLRNPDSILNPHSVFTAEIAFELSHGATCKQQTNLGTYFDVNDGITAESFRGIFPKPERTYRLKNNFFTPLTLPYLKVPNALGLFITRRNEDISVWKEKENEARMQLQLGIDNEVERNEIENQLNEARTNRQYHVNELNDLARSAQCELNGENKEILFSSMQIYETLKERNEFMKLAEQNQKKWDEISKKYTQGTPQYVEEWQKFRKSAILEFWHVFNTANNVTGTVISVRKWFEGLGDKANQWFENNQITESLSPYGNMIIRIMSEMDILFKIETNFQLALKLLGSKLSSYRFSWDLRPNVLLTGDGAIGKSFMFDWIELISVPGTVLNVTHSTTQAFQTDQDMSDLYFIHHEMRGDQLGVDRYGKEMASDPFFKNRLTKQLTTTIHPDKDSNKRQTVMSVNRCMGTTGGAHNEVSPSTSSPIMQRFLHHIMTKNTRIDLEKDDITYIAPWMTDNNLTQLITNRFQLQDFYFFVTEKAIEAKVLPDVDVTIAQIVAKDVFKEMQKKGVPDPLQRHIKMYVDLCRVYTIYYAIEMEFFSEYGLKNREDPITREAKEFDPLILCNLPKWFCCTQEIAVHILTLLESTWLPTLTSEIAKAIAFNMVQYLNNYKTKKWIPLCPSEHNSGTEFKIESINSVGEKTYNFQYIQVVGESLQVIASNIQANIKKRPSLNDIKSKLCHMQNEYIRSYQKYWKSYREDENGRNIEDYCRHKDIETKTLIQIESNQKCCNICKIEFENTEEFIKHIRKFLDKFCREYGKEPLVIWKQKFASDKTQEPCKIPCLIIDEDPCRKNKKRICIATDLINTDFLNILKESIPKALEHKFQSKERYITGFYYSRKTSIGKNDMNTIASIDEHEDETFCNVFDVIELKRGKNIKTVKNPFSLSLQQKATLYNRVGYQDVVTPNELHENAGFILDESYDYIHFTKHWLKHGIPEDEAIDAYPAQIKIIIWNERKTNNRWQSIEKFIIKDYPKNWIEGIDQKIKQFQDLNDTVERLENLDAINNNLKRFSCLYSSVNEGRTFKPKYSQVELEAIDIDLHQKELVKYKKRNRIQNEDYFTINDNEEGSPLKKQKKKKKKLPVIEFESEQKHQKQQKQSMNGIFVVY